ncbi:hypothetical protein [Pseudomonas sp. GL-RE-29]|uniref:hypothetical protein n=1 Tax=Pseudomonas sp. GL-RE-29 TaxID=2832375 RepID=UPI001CBE4058|nr:hypothetical protein [Pseudomonas sp. GL-RE-29]
MKVRHPHSLSIIFLLSTLTLNITLADDTNPSKPTLELDLKKLRPTPKPNNYCNPNLDSDILFGIGYELFSQDNYPEAKSCFTMAAPNYDRAFCYLAIIAQHDDEPDEIKRNTEALNYTRYAASKNDWCAEYRMYENYKYGVNGLNPDKGFALYWLKRSAMHGYPEAQQLLKIYHFKQGELPLSYAWSKIIGQQADEPIERAFKNMTNDQIIEGKKHLEKLSKSVTSKQTLKDEALKENIAFLSAGIHLDYPETFKDATYEERYEYIKKTVNEVAKKSKLKSKSDIFSFIVIARHAQKTQKKEDILNNKTIMNILENREFTTSEKIEKSLSILNKPQHQQTSS